MAVLSNGRESRETDAPICTHLPFPSPAGTLVSMIGGEMPASRATEGGGQLMPGTGVPIERQNQRKGRSPCEKRVRAPFLTPGVSGGGTLGKWPCLLLL